MAPARSPRPTEPPLRLPDQWAIAVATKGIVNVSVTFDNDGRCQSVELAIRDGRDVRAADLRLPWARILDQARRAWRQEFGAAVTALDEALGDVGIDAARTDHPAARRVREADIVLDRETA